MLEVTKVSGSIQFEGGKISYQTFNFSQEHCTIFIHGNSADSRWLEPTVRELGFRGYPVLSFDLPGHGKSSRYESYLLPRMTGALKEVISSLGIKKYSIVGWSYGANIALQCMSELEGLEKLAIVTSPLISLTEELQTSPFRNVDSSNFSDVTSDKLHLLASLSYSNLLLLGKSFLANNDHIPFKTVIPSQLFQSLQVADGNVRSDISKSIGLGMIADEFRIIQNVGPGVKICVLYGLADSLVNPRYIEESSEMLGIEAYPLEGGHAVLHEQPKEATDTLITFL